MTGHNAIEVAKTVSELADVAWTAVECCHHHHHSHGDDEKSGEIADPREWELEALRLENRRLRSLLESNLKLFKNLAETASLLHECPSDLSPRLLLMVTSRDFSARLEQMRNALTKELKTSFHSKSPQKMICRLLKF